MTPQSRSRAVNPAIVALRPIARSSRVSTDVASTTGSVIGRVDLPTSGHRAVPGSAAGGLVPGPRPAEHELATDATHAVVAPEPVQGGSVDSSARPAGPTLVAGLGGQQLRRLGVRALVFVLVGALVGFGATFLWPGEYAGRSTVLYLINQNQSAGFLREDQNLVTQTLLAQSNAVLAPVATQYRLNASDLQRKVTVSLADGSELITIEVRDRSPELATRMAADVTNSYLRASSSAQPAADQIRFVQNQLAQVQTQINQLTAQNTPAALAQIQGDAERASQLNQQLDSLDLTRVSTPTAQVVVPAFDAGKISPQPGNAVMFGALIGLLVAVVVVGRSARRWARAARTD